MRPRFLSIFLLLCVIVLPNRMAGHLLAAAPGGDASESRKSTEVRGRNRIGAPNHPEAAQGLVRLAGAPERPRPASMGTISRPDPSPAARTSPERTRPAPILIRLRC